MNVIAHI